MLKTIFLSVLLSTGISYAHCGSCGVGDENHSHKTCEKECTECKDEKKECSECTACSEKDKDKASDEKKKKKS